MPGLVLDTHAFVWMLMSPERLSETARRAVEQAVASADEIAVPAICLVEVAYLLERRRLPSEDWERIEGALTDPLGVMVVAPLDLDVATTLRRVPAAAVPDMPDRIIAATALHLGWPLVTRDRQIATAPLSTIW